MLFVSERFEKNVEERGGKKRHERRKKKYREGLGMIPGGGTLGISGWGCAAGTLEPLTYTRASSAEFCYPRGA